MSDLEYRGETMDFEENNILELDCKFEEEN